MSPRINTAALTWFGTQSVEKPTSVSYDDPARLESEKYSSQPAGGGGTPAITFFLGEDSRKKKEGGRESCCYGFFNFYLSLTTALRFNRGVERKKKLKLDEKDGGKKAQEEKDDKKDEVILKSRDIHRRARNL